MDLNSVKEQLAKRLIKYNIEDFALSQELHKNGEPHIHAWIKLTKKLDTTNSTLLDLYGKDKFFHGKYENAKKDKSSLEYVLKNINEGAPYLASESIQLRLSKEGTLKSIERTMIDLAKKGQIKEALDLLEKEKPREFLHRHKSLRNSLADIALIESGLAKPKFNLKDYHIDPDLLEILKNNPKNKTIVIIGEPGTGKTQFSITYLKEVLNLNPLVINNIDSIRLFQEGVHNAIVFDDCADWNYKDREEIIKLLDSEVSTTHNVKHGSISINKPTVRWAICNPPLPYKINPTDHAIQRRIIQYNLKETFIPKS